MLKRANNRSTPGWSNLDMLMQAAQTREDDADYWSPEAVRAAGRAFNIASPNPMLAALNAAEQVRRDEAADKAIKEVGDEAGS